jgi:hypothetical protein
MTSQAELLSRSPGDLASPTRVNSRSSWGVAAIASIGAAAAIGIGAYLASGSDPAPATATTATTAGPESTPPTGASAFPVSLGVQGWSCDEPADDKFACTKGGSAVLVTVRPAALHDAYLTDFDKASPDQYVSDVHGGAFATVTRTLDDHATDVFALGAVLRWQPDAGR